MNPAIKTAMMLDIMKAIPPAGTTQTPNTRATMMTVTKTAILKGGTLRSESIKTIFPTDMMAGMVTGIETVSPTPLKTHPIITAHIFLTVLSQQTSTSPGSMDKKLSRCFTIFLFPSILCAFLVFISAHPGHTDSRGGHVDRSTGKYHYHHGYGSHQHTDLDGDGKSDCPYNFDDRTGKNSGSSSSTSPSSHPSAASSTSVRSAEKQRYTWWQIVLLAALCILSFPFWGTMFVVPIFLVFHKLSSPIKKFFARIFKK